MVTVIRTVGFSPPRPSCIKLYLSERKSQSTKLCCYLDPFDFNRAQLALDIFFGWVLRRTNTVKVTQRTPE